MRHDESKSNLAHATLRGVSDPTEGCIPQGYVYLPGFKKNQSPPKRVFITRSPCTEASDGMVVPVICSESDLVTSPKHTPPSALEELSRLSFGLIVFPLGFPSLPSRINESDLDGDMFMVVWDEAIIGQVQECSDPQEDCTVERVDNPTTEWRENQHTWFQIVQPALVLNRSAEVNLLVKRSSCLWKKAYKENGINSTLAKTMGQVWKKANELDKHAGLVGLPHSAYNIITGKNKPKSKRSKNDKLIERLVMVNGSYDDNKKMLFEVGDKVTAPWLPKNSKDYVYYDGVVVDYRKVGDGDYGPVRTYRVKFDDDNTVRKCGDEYIFLREDYCMEIAKEKDEWHGVENINDEYSKDERARIVGWYVVTIGEIFHILPCLVQLIIILA